MRLKNWVLKEDGTYRAMDVPGLPNFEAWLSCWKVYRAILYMLRHTGRNGLEHKGYHASNVGKSTLSPLRAWCWSSLSAGIFALSRRTGARAELMPRLRRSLERAATQGEIGNTVTYDRDRPWDSVFRAAAPGRQILG